MSNNNNNIGSLDYLFESLYNSKFNEWLNNKFLRPVVKKDQWHMKSSDLSIQLTFIRNKQDDLNFIKGRFHIGLVHLSDPGEAQSYAFDLEDYAFKPELIGTINTRIVKEEGEVYFDLSYNFNFFPELDLVTYFNRLFDQIETIKDDIRFRLGVDLLESINPYNQEVNKDRQAISQEDKIENGDEDDDGEYNEISSPYDLGGN